MSATQQEDHGKSRSTIQIVVSVVASVAWAAAAWYRISLLVSDVRKATDIPESVSRVVFDGLEQIFVLFVVGLVALWIIAYWFFRRRGPKCSDALSNQPQEDLAHVVEFVAGSSSWCRRPESVEWAGNQCALIAAGELQRAVDIVRYRLKRYLYDWEQEINVGKRKTTTDYLNTAKEDRTQFEYAYSGSETVTETWRRTDELRERCNDLRGIIHEYLRRVLEELLRGTGNHEQRQRRAASAVEELYERANQVKESLVSCQASTRAALADLRLRIANPDADI